MKTALHATGLRNAFRPARSSTRLVLSSAGSLVARFPMSPAISASQEAPPVVGIIDSDPLARAALEMLLQPVGVDVVSFDTAESYLLSGSSRSLACLIVDLLLPGMSGLELLRRLRSNGNDVPVILLADESDVPTAVAAMREGATDFIEKPYVNVAILKQVQKLIRGQGGSVMPA
jgi:FixJ family two-component response regulator